MFKIPNTFSNFDDRNIAENEQNKILLCTISDIVCMHVDQTQQKSAFFEGGPTTHVPREKQSLAPAKSLILCRGGPRKNICFEIGSFPMMLRKCILDMRIFPISFETCCTFRESRMH